MKREMTLMELQDVLGNRIRVTLNEGLTPEQRMIENEQSRLIENIAKQMINVADIVMRSETLKARSRDLTESKMDDIIGE